MGRTALDKVHPHRPWRVRPQLLQLQPLFADLQGKLAVVHLQGQAEPLGPVFRPVLEGQGQGLDVDAAGRGLLTHGSCSFMENMLKKLRIGKNGR
jgi:hypothetical protein